MTESSDDSPTSADDHLIPHEVLNPFVARLDALNSTYDKVKVICEGTASSYFGWEEGARHVRSI